METRERSERRSVDTSASTSLIGNRKWQSGFWSRLRRRPTVLLGLTFVLVLSLTFWPLTARVLRAQILTVRTRDYVQAARAVGTPELRILLRHVLPGALPPVITQASLQVGSAILVEAGLSFLGLGDPNVVSWGAMLNDAQQFVFEAWWMSVFPGLAITLTVLGVNLVADALTEAWDPRLASE